MKSIRNKYQALCTAAFVYATTNVAFATGSQYSGAATSTGTDLLNYQNSAGDSSKKLTATTGNLGKMIADFLNLFLIGMTAFGIVLFGLGLYGVYKANADERETPKKAIWGMVIGAGMTCITTLAFLLRNNIVA